MSEEKSTVQVSALIDRLLANPQLMETIAALLRDAPAPTEEAATSTEADGVMEAAVADIASAQTSESDQISEAQAVPTAAKVGHVGERRHRLLCAIKPYLSEPRAKALDSIEAIAELMDILKHA